jgi:hypothetical protein
MAFLRNSSIPEFQGELLELGRIDAAHGCTSRA